MIQFDTGRRLTAEAIGTALLLGMGVAHAMFEEPILQLGIKARTGPAQWLAEVVAPFSLVATILATVRWRARRWRLHC